MLRKILTVPFWLLAAGILIPAAASGAPNKTETLRAELSKETKNENFPPFYGYQKLVGTMFVSGKNRQRNEAVLRNLLTGKKTRYAEKMSLPFGVRLKQILPDRVVLEKDGQVKVLSLRDQSPYREHLSKLRQQGYLKVGENEWVLDAHGLFENSGDIISLILDSGLHFQSDQGKSLITVGKTVKKSKLAQLGFVSGDQVLGVNGANLNGALGLYNSYRGIRKSEKVSIEVLRNNKVQTLSYWVATKGKLRYDMERVFATPAIMKLLLASTDLP